MSKRRNYPAHILPVHFEEWVTDSGVNELITTLNVRSLSDPREIDELLDRNTKSRWKHWEHGAGWSVTGIDPITGETTYEGAQFKPDNPVQRIEDGKPKFKKDGSPDLQKYFSVSGEETAPLFLDTGEPSYWLSVRGDVEKRLLITEGAKKAGAALTAGEACISIPGVGCGQKLGRLKEGIKAYCQKGRVIVLAFDADMFYNINVCRELDRLGRLICAEGAVIAVLMLPRDTKGLDDYIVAYGPEMFRQLVDESITFEEWRQRFIKREIQEVRSPLDFIPDVEDNYLLKAQAILFDDPAWVSIDGQMHKWTGTHYGLQSAAIVKRMIADWCSSTPVYSRSDGEWRYSYATATHVDNIYSWVQRQKAVDPATVNPPGLNCLSGVLKISWEGRIPCGELAKHDPSVVYTYVGEFEFNPDADSTACDRLLECLEPAQREIFIRTLAASLDLRTIRRFKGRGTKALLCKGDGNNGKDSLREAVALLYGIGVTGCTVSDFHSYDQGRKFTLAKLEHARISWSSENSSFGQLDNLQSLKAAITGDPIDLERKNQDERPMELATIFLFNINNVPNLQASLEAIQSRWAVLSFNKTFKTNADPSRGELEADPRFRYDPNFLKKEVVPALLNKMLKALPEVAMNGIDYSCTTSALQEIKEETNHLCRFANEVGLDYQVGGRISASELWEMLRQWYIDYGYAEVEKDAKGKEKLVWTDSGNRNDRPVKTTKDVISRFLEVFPKAKRDVDTTRANGHPGRAYIQGIGLVGQASNAQKFIYQSISSKIDFLTVEECQLLISELNKRLHTQGLPQLAQHREPAKISRLNVDSTNGSTVPLQGNVTPSVNESPSSIAESSNTDGVRASTVAGGNVTIDNSKNFPPNHTRFKIGDRVAHVQPQQKSYNWHGTVVGFDPDSKMVMVRWKEKRGEPLRYQPCELRLIQEEPQPS